MRYGSRSPRLGPHDAARSSRAPSIAREHPTVIEGYDISFTVKRGELTTVRLTADKPGVFEFRCGVHEPSMVGELIVLPGS